MTLHLDESTAAPGAILRQAWRFVTIALVLAIFAQVVFAGAILSGFEWARTAHAANALAVLGGGLTAGVVSVVTLRHVRNGLKLGLLLLTLAVVVFVQFALGRMAARGANLMWAHVPLGVLLVGLAAQAVASARQLGVDA